MNDLFTAIIAVLFVVSAFIMSLKPVHMLQLSSYQTFSYWKWLKRAAKDYYTKQWTAFILVIAGLTAWPLWLVLIGMILIMLCEFKLRKPAKKPLVYTSRVKRLLCVQVLLLSVSAWGFYRLGDNYRLTLLILAATYLLIPFITMLSNFMTMPFQQLINQHYINDAKKILSSRSDLKIIGITGSYGKTSMKFILTRLLSAQHETLMTPDSYNTTLGVVRTIREKLQPTHEYFVCEMGARHVGDIREICDIVHPHMGILTSVGEQHMETFKTLDNIINTKFELINAVTGTAFLNLDSAPVREHVRPGDCVTYALDNQADYTADNLMVDCKGSTFTVHTPTGESVVFTTTLLGRHSILNILGAVAVSHTLGIPLKRLTEPVSRLPQVKHRMEIVKGDSFTIIDDAFNANPGGVKAALDTLAMFDGIKVVITPGMIELGERQDELNRIYGEQLAEVCDHVILVGAKQTEPILWGLGDYKDVTVVESFKDAMACARTLNADVVLLANDLPDNY